MLKVLLRCAGKRQRLSVKAFLAGAALTLAAFTLAALAQPALADTTLGWYVAADVGEHQSSTQKLDVRDITVQSPGLPANPTSYRLKSDKDVAAFVRTGYRLSSNWRTEVEYGHRPAQVRAGLTDRPDEIVPADGKRGSQRMQTLMLNVIYDLAPNSRLHPFVGAGVGAVDIRTNVVSLYGTPGNTDTYTLRSKQTGVGAQLLAGVTWPLTERLNLDLTYRYLQTAKMSHRVTVDQHLSFNDGEDGTYNQTLTSTGSASGRLRNQSLTIGLRLAMGASAPAAPAIETHPYVPPAAPAPKPAAAPPVSVVTPPAAVLPAPRSFLVLFPFDKSYLTTDAKVTVKDAAAYALSAPSAKVTVVGHTDTSGSMAYNVALSKRRSKAVTEGLVKEGVAASAISQDWKGETDLAIPTKDGVPLHKNRRSTIEVSF